MLRSTEPVHSGEQQIDIELAALLNSLSFESSSFTVSLRACSCPQTLISNLSVCIQAGGAPTTDMTMMSDEDRGYQVRCLLNTRLCFPPDLPRLQSDSSDVSARSSHTMQHASHPCTLMQSFAFHHGLSDAVAGHVSDNELSQLIFAHREAFLSCPSAHAGCSAGFKVLASHLEKLAQPMDSGAGMDVVRMLRTEAWLLSGA